MEKIMKRNIIKIDEEKCNGCGQCVTGCPEGAIQMVNGKARLVSENYCDGLGACIGDCPVGAISVEEREATAYSEALVMENMIRQGEDVVRKHLEHLLEHKEMELYDEAIDILAAKGINIEPETPHQSAHNHASHNNGHGCPGSMNMVLQKNIEPVKKTETVAGFSRLNQWPVKLKLLSPDSPVFSGGVDLLVSADCAPYASGNFHEEFLNGRIMLTFCPKLDPYIDEYREKLTAIFTNHEIRSITLVRMEVPCCGGVTALVQEALKRSGKNIPVDQRIVKIV
jgi:NAD-dependent dihydropyrimidine dehydrogenase PreA subunit